jgi:hypothetical protein
MLAHTQIHQVIHAQLATMLTVQRIDSASHTRHRNCSTMEHVELVLMLGLQVTIVNNVQRDSHAQPCMDLPLHVSKDSIQMLEPLSAQCANLTLCAPLLISVTEWHVMMGGTLCPVASIAIPWELTCRMMLPMIDQDPAPGERYQRLLKILAPCAIMASSVHQTTLL